MLGIRLKSIFSEKDLREIADAVADAEKRTAGEIRVSIRQRRGFGERTMPLEAIAEKEFHALGMTATKDGTGVLIFVIFEDRRFRIVADKGIHEKVGEGTWQRIAQEMSSHFSAKRFKEGILRAIDEVGKVLTAHFPSSPDDKNELPNAVRIR